MRYRTDGFQEIGEADVVESTPDGDVDALPGATDLAQRLDVRIIAEGVPGTTMIGWRDVLTEGEIRAVYRHVCSLGADRPEGSGG